MTGSPRIVDLTAIEVEHLLGATYGPLVKVRIHGTDIITLGQITPAEARQIAGHLLEAAARAEYEADFYTAATRANVAEPAIAAFLDLVRQGEIIRHTKDLDR